MRSIKFLMFAACFCMLTTTKAQMDTFWSNLGNSRVESESTILWEQVAPGNAGYANLIRYHPTIPGRVIEIPDMWNAYQSGNNGDSWFGITDPDGDAKFYHIRDVYFSESDPAFALAVGSSVLWNSTDTAKTWQQVTNCPWYAKASDGTESQAWMKKVASLGIDPKNKDIWFVGGGMNVRGQDWLSCYQDVNASNYRGISATNEGKLWRTTNAGSSWTLVNSGLDPKAQIGRIIVNPKNTQQVFASSNYGVYRSNNGGTSWTQISEGQLDNNVIMDMDYYYNAALDTFILYVIDQVHYIPDGTTTKCSGGIFYSSNEGNTWTKMNGDLALDINRLTGGVPANYYKYIASWFGITQTEAKATYPNLPTQALQYFNMISTDPSRLGAVYIGFADPQVANSIMPGRLWVTTNNGGKWINTARLYEDTWQKDAAYWNERGNPWNENMVVGHQSPHMRFGTDYALRSMRALDVGIDGSVMIVSDHSTMLSTDHGATWRQKDEYYTPSGAIVGRGNSNLPAIVIGQDKRNDHSVLGSGEHGVWIPENEDSYGKIPLKYIPSSTPTITTLAFDPYNSKIVYSTSNRQDNKQDIFRSDDGGNTWAKHGVATPATNKFGDDFYTNALTINPIDNKYFYFGITEIADAAKSTLGGFYVSNDNGKTFMQSNSGLPSPARVSDIEFDVRDNTRKSLFAACEKNAFTQNSPVAAGGLYHSGDNGASWTKVNTPAEVQGVNYIAIDNTNRMYITTGYRGNGAGVWYTDNFGASWVQCFKYAETESIDISPFDNNFIIVTVGFTAKNPGVYVSRDRGLTWVKSNKSITIPHKVEDVKFDIYKPGEVWLATLGTGFYKGKIKDGQTVQVVDINESHLDFNQNNSKDLTATIVNSAYSGELISWKSENTAIAEVDANGKVTPKGKGKTRIWASAVDGRFTDYCEVVVTDISTGIGDVKEQKSFVFPMPVKSLFTINGLTEGSNFQIVDISGRTVLDTEYTGQVDISSFRNGVYLLKLNDGNNVVTQKIIKN